MNLLVNNIQFSKLNLAIILNYWETDVILKNVQNNLVHIFLLLTPSPWVSIILPQVNYTWRILQHQHSQMATSRSKPLCCAVHKIWFLHTLSLFILFCAFFIIIILSFIQPAMCQEWGHQSRSLPHCRKRVGKQIIPQMHKREEWLTLWLKKKMQQGNGLGIRLIWGVRTGFPEEWLFDLKLEGWIGVIWAKKLGEKHRRLMQYRPNRSKSLDM